MEGLAPPWGASPIYRHHGPLRRCPNLGVPAEVGGAVRPGVAGPGHVLGGCVQRWQGSALCVVEQVLEAPAKLAADVADVAGQVGGGDAVVHGHGPDTAAGLGEPGVAGRG